MSDNYSTILLKKGSDHLHAAGILSTDSSVSANLICFHCQQATEKLFKSFLSANNIMVKKNESLLKMFKLCLQTDEKFKQFDEKTLICMDSYGVERLYSSYNKEATEQITNNLFKLATDIKKYIESISEK